MPSKSKKKAEAVSKKNAQKKKEKTIEDKTFGMKNKNKSKKVQAEVNAVIKSVMGGPNDAMQRKLDEQKKQKKMAQKALKKAQKDEQNALFNEALSAVSKKKDMKKGKVDALGRDHGDDDKKGGQSRAMKMMFQMDAQEMNDKLREDPNYVPTLEDEIESQRQKLVEDLKKKGVKGTPVTQETLREWQGKKRKQKEDAARKLVEAEMKKKKGGKGLSVLSGRALYAYNQSLFVDQDDDNIQVVDNENYTTQSSIAGREGADINESNAASDQNDAIHEVSKGLQSELFLDENDDDDDLDDLIEDDDNE